MNLDRQPQTPRITLEERERMLDEVSLACNLIHTTIRNAKSVAMDGGAKEGLVGRLSDEVLEESEEIMGRGETPSPLEIAKRMLAAEGFKPTDDDEMVAGMNWRQEKSEKLKNEIVGTATIEGLLKRAEELVIFSNPLNPNFTDGTDAFIIEARQRLKEMPEGDEKTKLQTRLDKVYSDFCVRGNL